MKKLALHWQIIIGIVAGILFGLGAAQMGWTQFVIYWVKPFGDIFISLLKLIAVPLILVSLIKGVGDLKDISKLSKMGSRTIGIYLFTTLVAIAFGLLIVNVFQPGKLVSPETRAKMEQTFGDKAAEKQAAAAAQRERREAIGPLYPLVDMVPDNFFKSATDNGKMLQVIFFALFFGIGLILVPEEKAAPVRAFFDGLNEIILKLIDIIMLGAPFFVFALLAAVIVQLPSPDLLVALLGYSACVAGGLIVLTAFFYPTLVKVFAKREWKFFFNGIAPAQLLAFSTSSSAATLPVTMERVEEHLGVDEEVSSFVLPIGATINMDGTALYQGVAAVFIAQTFGMELGLGAQLGILLTALLASIGSAAVPSAGMVMLVIVLGQAGIPEAGLALIFAVDRPLDMLRTVTNVTSDATVAMIVARSVDKLGEPHVKEWDDAYPKG